MDKEKIEFLDWAVAELDKDAASLERALGELYGRRRDVIEAKRKLLAKAIIAETGLRKSMVIYSTQADEYFGTAYKFLEWIDANRPESQWLEWNGNVYSKRKLGECGRLYETPLRYDELED